VLTAATVYCRTRSLVGFEVRTESQDSRSSRVDHYCDYSRRPCNLDRAWLVPSVPSPGATWPVLSSCRRPWCMPCHGWVASGLPMIQASSSGAPSRRL
jgi:hypothetical protein